MTEYHGGYKGSHTAVRVKSPQHRYRATLNAEKAMIRRQYRQADKEYAAYKYRMSMRRDVHKHGA